MIALDSAMAYCHQGLSAIPIRTDGSKAPAVSWTPYQHEIADDATCRSWWSHEHGVALVCGAVSGNLEVIDVDDGPTIKAFEEVVEQCSPGLLDKLVPVDTPRLAGGRQYVYRLTRAPEGNQKLALDETGKVTLIETRGTGGYVLTVGSPASCHPANREYRFATDRNHRDINVLTDAEHNALFQAARMLCRKPIVERHDAATAPIVGNGTNTAPGGEYNERVSWQQVLEPHGWKLLGNRHDRLFWQRPGKAGAGNSATSGNITKRGNDVLKVFSSNAAPFDSDETYTKFAAYAILNHGGDYSEAARCLGELGYGELTVSRGGVSASITCDEPWPDPEPLMEDVRDVEAFEYDLLPPSLRDWIRDIADRLQCPPDFPAIAAMVVMSAVIGRQIGIRPKRMDVWCVIPNLWGCGIGRPGIMKTPAFEQPLKMARRLEVEAQNERQAEVSQFRAQRLVNEQYRKVLEQNIKTATRNDDFEAADEHAQELLTIEEQLQHEPRPRQIVVNDSTVQRLGMTLADHPLGILVVRDELVGMLRALDSEGQEGARAFFLEGWNGNQSSKVERVTRDDLFIKANTLAVLGGIQPGKLQAYLGDAVKGGERDDGLLQRFQLAVWPNVSREFHNIDRWPDTSAKDAAWAAFQRCASITADDVDAVPPDEDDESGVPTLRFDSDAQDQFDQWRCELEKQLRSETLPEYLESHLAKYRSLIPSIALIYHLSDGRTGAVTVESLDVAIRWSRYLISHAKRIYSYAMDRTTRDAITISQRIVAGKLQDGFTARDIYRAKRDGICEKESAEAALKTLVEAGWIRSPDDKSGRGRPTRRYEINPDVLSGEKSGKSPRDHAQK